MAFFKTKTNFLKTFCDTRGLTQGDYYCRIYLNDINLPSSEVITKENILRLEAMGGTNFHLHPQILYRTTYVNSIDNQTKLSISLPKLNYYEKDANGNNVKHFKDVRLLLLPSTLRITTLDANNRPTEEIDEQLITNTCILHANQSGYNYYLSNSKFDPELFDTQHIECHLMTFNQKIPKGTYIGFLVYRDSDGNYHLFDPIPKVKDAYPKIQITYTKPEVDTTQLPTAINVKTLSLNDLQTKKISITIKADYFVGKQIDPDTREKTFIKWIKIKREEEDILPLTKVTEVTEDYDRNEVKITIPLYYLFGLTEKPAQLPELEKGNYQIQIYTLSTASTPISTIQIKANEMPFVLKFYHHDHLGTVRYITNESGEILHTTDTLAYGEELTAPYEDSNDKVLNTITYTGHEKDYETNLTYMLARYYSQGYGRFLSPDPGYDYDQLDPMSWNLYSYVRGNPIIGIDPLGLTVYVITYVEGDDSFKAAAETRKQEIEKSENFDPEKDKVVMVGAKTIKDAVNKINAAVASLNGAYGDVGALEVYSHSGPNDGPYFDKKTEVKNSREYNLSLWKDLDLTWEDGAEIRLYGCNTGRPSEKYGESFAQAMADTFGIPVWGQPTYSGFSNIKGKVTPVRSHLQLYPRYLQAQDGWSATGIGGFYMKWNIYSQSLMLDMLPLTIIYTWHYGNPFASVYPMIKFNPKRRKQ